MITDPFLLQLTDEEWQERKELSDKRFALNIHWFDEKDGISRSEREKLLHDLNVKFDEAVARIEKRLNGSNIHIQKFVTHVQSKS